MLAATLYTLPRAQPQLRQHLMCMLPKPGRRGRHTRWRAPEARRWPSLAHSAHLRLIELHDQPVRGHLWVSLSNSLRVSTGAHGTWAASNRDSQSALVLVANISPTSVSRAIALADLAAPVQNRRSSIHSGRPNTVHLPRHSASDRAPAVMYPSAAPLKIRSGAEAGRAPESGWSTNVKSCSPSGQRYATTRLAWLAEHARPSPRTALCRTAQRKSPAQPPERSFCRRSAHAPCAAARSQYRAGCPRGQTVPGSPDHRRACGRKVPSRPLR